MPLLVTMKWAEKDPDDDDVVPLEGMLITNEEEWQLYCRAVDKYTVDHYLDVDVYHNSDRLTISIEDLNSFMSCCHVRQISGSQAAVLRDMFGGDSFGAVPKKPEVEDAED